MTLRSFPGMVVLAEISMAAEPDPTAADPGPTQGMDAFVVTATRYKDSFPPAPRFTFGFSLSPIDFRFPDFGGPGPFVLTAARRPQPPRHVAPTAEVVFDADIRIQPSITLENALLQVPSFVLSSRRDSLSAEPGGVGLRGIGPARVSRTLVLLDGVPLNDPFNGAIRWTKVPREGLARVECVPDSGATAWGNSALAGTVQLFTRPVRGRGMWVRLPPPPGTDRLVEGPLAWGTRGTLHGSTAAGDFGTRSVEFCGVYPAAAGLLQVLGRTFTTNGFVLISPDDRGPVDTPAWSRHRWLAARWRQPLGKDAEFAATARGFEESRGGGTAYMRSSSREKFVSTQLTAALGSMLTCEVLAYALDQSSAARNSIVDAPRSTEMPQVDQFAVPASTVGVQWTAAWRHPNYPNRPNTTAGGDIRTTRGEVRENLAFRDGSFSRQRIAGGRQTSAGFFVMHDRQLTEAWRGTLGARLDAWRDTDGHRQEWELSSGLALGDERYPDRGGLAFSPSAGLVWQPRDSWRFRASAQHGFRRPTLDELYRPEHDDERSIEANPYLRTERVTGGDAGFEWSLVRWRQTPRRSSACAAVEPAFTSVRPETTTGSARARSPPKPKAVTVLSVSATVFANQIRNFVSEIPLPTEVAGAGTRWNRAGLDRVHVTGAEMTARWAPAARLTVLAASAYQDGTIQDTRLAAALTGKRLPQVARRRGMIAVTWQAPYALTMVSRARWTDRQFDDVENLRPLDRATVVDFGVTRPAGKHLEVFLAIENIADARVETGRSATGIVSVGTPRFALGGIRGNW